ncbi:MAG TPA: 2-oxoacid:acceptor oxidoreductase subunit alpha [Synergistaceae bacterium]|nr:2-oxoacid:acceptor oxidoreductase subunit alpha [Synergistaceae bacterium]HPQ38128.1 2-oxoacid:acceptor oxidoreductase subunit alpha [Synergistaceae bacterium]
MQQFPREGHRDVSVVLCGAAGQGIQTVEELLVRLGKSLGYHVYANREYMSRVRGGHNSTAVRIASSPVRALVDRIDILVPLGGGIRKNVLQRMDSQTLVIGDMEELREELEGYTFQSVHVPFLEIAQEAGGAVFANLVATAVVAGLFADSPEVLRPLVEQRFGKKGDEVIAKNMAAASLGFEKGREILHSGKCRLSLASGGDLSRRVAFDGAHGISLGALAGGCSFCCGYPMSPATGVLTFMIQQGERFGVAAEQVEDEIAAINMAVGASYAGARSMVTTSGGGFALMTEGFSLAGVTECPLVVHLAQRPGPATGMATRTEQGDLAFALHGGHGEFPRAILAPGTLEEAFFCAKHAFSLADRYQVPVVVLTDQYLMNTYYDLPGEDLNLRPREQHIVETSRDYRRYEVTEDGVSPRGIPGYGEGIVGVDSHEHDEEGHVWEDFELRTRMNAKRLSKLESLREEALAPLLLGPENYRTLLLSWGSTRCIAEEALERLGWEDTALLHIVQPYPLHEKTLSLLEKAETVIALEGNATGQLCTLLRAELGFEVERKVLTWKGLQFSVEEVMAGLQELRPEGGVKNG